MHFLEEKLQQYQRITGQKFDPAALPEPHCVDSKLRPLVASIMVFYSDERQNEILSQVAGYPKVGEKYSAHSNPGFLENEQLGAELAHLKAIGAKWKALLT